MKVFSIILFMIGPVFLALAYEIYFKKSYHLINGFEKDYNKGLKDEKYAIRVGKVYFVISIFVEILAFFLFFTSR